MNRNLLVVTTAIALIVFPLHVPGAPGSFGARTVFAAEIDAGLLQRLEIARAAIAAAEAALADALSKGGETEAAQRALEAARSELGAAEAEVTTAKAATDDAGAAGKKAAAGKAEAGAQEAERKAAEEKAASEVTESGEKAAAKKAETQSIKAGQKTAEELAPEKKAAKAKKLEEVQSEAPAQLEAKPEEKKTGEAPAIDSQTKAAAQSEEAPEAKPLAVEPIAEQIEKAEEQAPAVVPEEISGADLEKLKAAEKVRRAEAKQKRAELIGAAAAGVAIGAVIPTIGGRVIADEGDRFVVERNGELTVRKDESALLRGRDADVEYEQLAGGRVRETITRPNGARIVTLRDAGGYVLKRTKILPNGDEIVLFDWRNEADPRFVDYDRTLSPIRLGIPREEYIVAGSRANRRSLYDMFQAPPVEKVRSGYTLREVRESRRLRDIVRRVDLDTITFDSGSATVRASQVPLLGDIAGGMLDVIERKPGVVFLIEGHTDAVGADVYNLTLSDRRAETVARILSEGFEVPAENLVTQGYGEQFLKLDTLAAEQQNRRVTVRNISPLLISASR